MTGGRLEPKESHPISISPATHTPSTAEAFQVGEWTVEPSLSRLVRGERSVKVEPRVMELLVFLAQRPGRVVTRRELLDGVWAGAIVEDSTMTSTVARLRRALVDGQGRTSSYVETIPKRGYRLVARVSPAAPGGGEQLPPGAVSPLACVARELELAALEERLAAVRVGVGGVVFVTGDAGAGKTVLVHELLARALTSDDSIVPAVGACNFYNGSGDHFLPFRQILSQLTADLGGLWPEFGLGAAWRLRLRAALPAAVRAIGRRGPDLVGTLIEPRDLRRRLESEKGCGPFLGELAPLFDRGSTAAAVSADWREDLLEQTSRFLEEVAASHPLLLILEDLQWADGGTLDLLFHIARRIATRRILVVATYRPEDVNLGQLGGRHPLRRVVNELRRLFGDVELKVGACEPARFVHDLLALEPNRLDEEFREALTRWSGGHALFTVELLRHLRETGSVIRAADGTWEVAAPVRWETVPPRVEGVIGERVERLPDPLRQLLGVAAVEGEEFTADVVARVSGTKLVEVIGLLHTELDRRHQLVRAAGERTTASGRLTRFRFSHFLVQQYLYQRLAPAERRHLHRGVAESLRALRGDDPELAVTLARHCREADMPAEAITYLRLAGERAALVSAHDEAISHFDRALELLPRLGDPDQRCALELALEVARLGPLQVATGTSSSSIEHALARVEKLCRVAPASAALGRALLVLFVRHSVFGDSATAERLAAQLYSLSAELGDDGLVVAPRATTTFFVHQGRFGEVRAASEAVMAIYSPERHHHLAYLLGWDPGVASLGNLSWCLWYQGRASTAAERARAALDLAQQLGHAGSLACAHLCAAHLNVLTRDGAGAMRHARVVCKLAAEHRLEMWKVVGTATLGRALVVAGRLRGGERALREVLRLPFVPDRTLALRYLGEALSRTGRTREALEVVSQGLRRTRETVERMTEVELRTLQGELLAREGHGAAAEEALREALRVAGEQGARLPALSAALALVRVQQVYGRVTDGGQLLADAIAELPERDGHPDVAIATAMLVG